MVDLECPLLGVKRTYPGFRLRSEFVKVFGCRPMKVVPRTAGPASANLQGRKPREGIRWWCGVRYGDLSAASAVADGGRRDCGSCAGAKRCMNRRWLASNAVGTCPI